MPLLICPWPCLSHAARMPRLRLPWSTALFFPITSHVTMGELLNPFEPQFIYQQKGYSTLPSVPLSKVYLQHLQYVGLSAFGHTHTHIYTHTTSFLSLLDNSFTSPQAKVFTQTPKLSMELLMCTSLTLLLLITQGLHSVHHKDHP